MEIYSFYTFVESIMDTLNETLTRYGEVNPDFKPIFSGWHSYLWSMLAISLGLWLVFFIFQAFGLYFMAKKQNRTDKYLAFIPFAQTLYMSKLAGKCSFFGRTMKNAGMYAMIAEIVYVAIGALTIAAKMYLYLACGAPTPITENYGSMQVITGYVWTNIEGFAEVVYTFYLYSAYIISIFELVYNVLFLIVLLALIRKYSPKHYFVLSLLSWFIPVARPIIIFVLRNKPPINYEAYMRRQRADYIRRQQQYYNQFGNPYANGYGNTYGTPQGNNPQNASTQNAANNDDPFEEFSSKPNASNENNTQNAGANSTGNGGADTDEFFN